MKGEEEESGDQINNEDFLDLDDELVDQGDDEYGDYDEEEESQKFPESKKNKA